MSFPVSKSNSGGPVQAGSQRVSMSAQGIRKSFAGKEVLRGISLELHQGEHVAVIGPSGSGKSTFIRCLNLLETPDNGSIDVLGERVFSAGDPVRESQVRALRLRVGMVFQSFNLFATYTALENVSLAQRFSLGRSKGESDDRSEQLLRRVGLEQHIHKHPSQLSGGQQQRVAIARALALDPQVMLFDEPTSAIDPEMRVEVLQVMKALALDGMTMIMVTHELRFAQEAADRVAFIADGEVQEIGTPAQVFGSPKNERTRRFVDAVSGEL
ncbi:amino acid ABC transporter ATP-binding protein [Lysinimonas soli]|uniref:Amino acid ABC transporter ATP-binding protein n=1 Tax=Lysinimonas soli TaxID=1074233 RepID=A0ABW0NUS5_9MICO